MFLVISISDLKIVKYFPPILIMSKVKLGQALRFTHPLGFGGSGTVVKIVSEVYGLDGLCSSSLLFLSQGSW